MSEIIALGYVGVTAPELDKFSEFATGVMGMTIGKGSTAEQLRLRMDERTWRLWVEPGAGQLAFCGWEVASAIELDQLATRLDGLGIAVQEDARLAKERSVNGLMVCNDPDGNQLEFFHGAHISRQPYFSPLGRRFVTGYEAPGDMGLGHLGLMFADSAAAQEFYMGILGFRLSDTVFGTPFVHVNRRHHSLVIGGTPPGRSAGLHHIMFEVEDLDMVGYALDTIERRTGETITLTLGKHTNDQMTSFYVTTPGGFDIEYGCGGVHVDDRTWTTSSYNAISFWGHLGAMAPPVDD
jgi:3,4-dihydroxy-9,10-secoandrosta-1,3,5(10)-triene-9,17-dione 4,5-dioxygenase